MSLLPDDDFNNEIVEIFVEEVDEVLELIDANFSVWKDNADNEQALKEIRRAFHTLKGSGRMVQAEEIGELAWSIENMLNRILDKTLALSPAVFDLILDVRQTVPTLVDAFKNRQAAALAGVNYGQMIERAEEIVSGKGGVDLGSIHSSTEPALLHAEPAVAAPDLQTQTELTQLKQQVSELKRDVLALSTQLDTLTTKVNVLPRATSVDEVDGKLSQFSDELQQMQGQIKTSLSALDKEAEEARQKLGAKFEKDLRDVSDLTGQLKADFNHEASQLGSKVNAIAIKWAVLSASAAGIAVYVMVKFV